MGRFLGLYHPFFIPLSRRVIVVAILLAWAAFEISNGATIWGAFFGVLGIICVFEFFVIFDPKKFERKDG